MSEQSFTVNAGLVVKNGLTVEGGTIDFSGASSGGGVELTDLSVTNAAAGSSTLAYDNATGVFTFTPPDLSTYATTSSLSSYATTASLAAVATSGAYADITGTPTLATVATSGAYADITGTPTLATVATSGAYSDLTGTPSVPTTTDNLTEGSTNLYFTNARASSAITGSDLDMGGNKVLFANVYSAEGNLPSASTYHGMFAHVHGTGKGYFAHAGSWHKLLDETSSTTANLTEGTNLYYTDARVDSRLSSGNVATITTSGDITVGGDLTVSGTTTTVNTETINLADNTITLNSNYTGSSPTEDGGIEIERGTLTNKTLVWDETNDKWTVGSETFVAGTFEGNLTGNVTGTVSSLSNHDTDDVSEGSSNLYYTDARARAAVSATTGAAGTAALSYNSSTGAFTFTPPDLSSYATTASLSSYLQNINSESLSDLSDVASTAPSDGQVLTYDTTNGWQPETPASGGIALTDLSASTGTASGGGSLSYNNVSGQFTLNPPDLSSYATTASLATVATSGAYSDLTGAPTALTDTDDLTEGSTNLYHTTARARSSISANTSVSATGSGNVSYNQVNGEITFYPPDLSSYLTDITGESLSDLSDVASTTPTDGQVLTYDTTNGWQPETPSSGGSSINWIASANTSSAGTPGNGGIALGGNTSVGSDAVAVGNYAVASASESVAVGSSQSSTAHLKTNISSSGSYGVAIGSRAQVHGNGGISMGWQAEAGTSSKAWSIAIGNQAISQYEKSVAIGYSATTTADRQLMLGGTTTNGFTSIRVGNTSYTPTDNMDLATKAYVDSAGGSSGGVPGAAEGTVTTAATATGTSALAVGYDVDAGGSYGTAVGFQANAGATASVALGYLANTSTGSHTIAIGSSADAQGTYGIALGLNSEANQNYSAAIGYFATASQANQLMLGRNSNTNGFTSIRVGNTSYVPSDAMDLTTKSYVDTAVAGAGGGGSSFAAADYVKVNSTTTAATATGTDGIAIGYDAHADGELRKISIGHRAGKDTTVGNDTISIGYYAGYKNKQDNAVYIGRFAGYAATNNTTANRDSDVGIGYQALYSGNGNYSGEKNVAIGYSAMGSGSLTGGTDNTCVGRIAGTSITNGQGNVLLGANCGYSVTGGLNNVAIGNNAGYNYQSYYRLTNNTYCTLIGGSTSVTNTNTTREVVIGYGLQAKGSNTFYVGATSGAYHSGNTSSWSTTSDERVKKNIADYTTGLTALNQINVKSFNYKTDEEIATDSPELADDEGNVNEQLPEDKQDVGIIAQQLEAVLPNCVTTRANGMKTVVKDELFWVMLNAIKELSAKNDALEARIVALENA